MAGKIIADQIEHSTAGSLDTSYVVNGSAKVWVHINNINSVISVGNSLNTSSITDVQTGVNRTNYLNSFSSAETGITVSVYTTGSYSNWVRTTGYLNQYSNSHEHLMVDESDNFYAATSNDSTVHGDLA